MSINHFGIPHSVTTTTQFHPQDLQYPIMLRVLDILEQFESRHFSHRLSSDVIGRVVPRAVIASRQDTVSRECYDHKTHTHHPAWDIQYPGRCTAELPKPKSRRKLKGTAEYREMWRILQERYRKKQDQRIKDAVIVVDKLRQDIPLLEMQRTRMIFSPELTLDAVVAEYFQLFRHGILSEVSDSQECHIKAKTQHQLVFLRTAIANNVVLGNQRGLDNLIDQWQRYSTYFEDIVLQLGYVTKVSDGIIWVYATLSVTITDTTVAYVFPHLTKCNKLERLRSRVQGERLVLPYRVCFEWDKDTKRVARLETMVDFFPPLFRVFGSLQDVVLVLEKAFITSDSVIGNRENASEP